MSHYTKFGDFEYIINFIENHIDEYINKYQYSHVPEIHELREELRDELMVTDFNELVNLIELLIEDERYDILSVILDNLDEDYIIKNKQKFKKFFDTHILKNNYITIDNFIKKVNNNKHTLKNKLKK